MESGQANRLFLKEQRTGYTVVISYKSTQPSRPEGLANATSATYDS